MFARLRKQDNTIRMDRYTSQQKEKKKGHSVP
jgi:hypothetical protein